MLASVCNLRCHSSIDCLSVDNHVGLPPPPGGFSFTVPFIMAFDDVDPSDILHTVGRLQLKYDGTLGHTGREVKRKLANGVGSQYSSHYLGTWCIQHYYQQ